MATARDIYDTAPIGSVITFSDGSPKPPDRGYRRSRALETWRCRNGRGKLVAKSPPVAALGGLPSFTLELRGDLAPQRLTISTRDPAKFTIVLLPEKETAK